jgi:ABC-type multidrug transport system ATPase subunit
VAWSSATAPPPPWTTLNFDVLPGTVTGFLGPNGAGKSTTMRMILGLDRPDAGVARINGQKHRDLRWPLREVGSLLGSESVPPRPHRQVAPDHAGRQQ